MLFERKKTLPDTPHTSIQNTIQTTWASTLSVETHNMQTKDAENTTAERMCLRVFIFFVFCGGYGRVRTCDRLVMSQWLCQLSYVSGLESTRILTTKVPRITMITERVAQA